MTTPIRRQYLEIKRRYPQAIVFFRLGDFYETFDEDAKVCARELDIALTSRPMGKGLKVPLAGIPYHAVDSYLAKLIAKGYKVAICEQTGESERGRGLMDRQVVRVVTPGTVVEAALVEEQANNYLAALVEDNGQVGIAYVDVTTGEFAATQGGADLVPGELARIRPAELLLPEGSSASPGGLAVTYVDESWFEPELAQETLLAHFGAISLEGLALTHRPLAAAAAAVILRYLQENQRAVLGHIVRLSVYNPTAYMVLDPQALRNLEVFEPLRQGRNGISLLGVLNLTKTAMGARLLRRWLGQPLLDVDVIRQRQDAVALFHSSAVLRGQTQKALGQAPDLERLLGRISAGNASPRELVALRRGLEVVAEVRQVLEGAQADDEGQKQAQERLLAGLDPCSDVAQTIAEAITDDPTTTNPGGVIRPGFAAELDELKAVGSAAQHYLADLERKERERTGIRSLKVGYNKVFGYYLEVSKSNLKSVPAHWERRQSLLGAERFTTAELREYELQVLHAGQRIAELEAAILNQVFAQVAAQGQRILDVAATLGRVDVFCALAEVASRYGYIRPEVDDSDQIAIRDGRHPMVERALEAGAFVPNDSYLGHDAQIIVLTGPNMAGKSTYLRQVALIALLAQVGSYVPASSARIGVVDRVFTRVGAADELTSGYSTFMMEMLETAHILHSATPRSLVILDEIGRGTSTYDGLAIARAVVEFLHNRAQVAAKTLFATHYHELIDLARFLPRVRNFNVAMAEEGGQVVFLHRIVPGGADKSYGIHVAQLAGLPRAVVQRAQEVLAELEESQQASANSRRRRPSRDRTPSEAQLPLFPSPLSLIKDLASLDVDSLTPLQAITKLYELKARAREAGDSL